MVTSRSIILLGWPIASGKHPVVSCGMAYIGVDAHVNKIHDEEEGGIGPRVGELAGDAISDLKEDIMYDNLPFPIFPRPNKI